MAPIFTASAVNAPTRTPPADRALPRAATIPEIQPALTLTAPPKAAESALCVPARSPAKIARTAVAMTCHRRTVRIGLLSKRGFPVLRPTACKARKL